MVCKNITFVFPIKVHEQLFASMYGVLPAMLASFDCGCHLSDLRLSVKERATMLPNVYVIMYTQHISA